MSAVGYQYVVLRCVPRVDREEFVNAGAVLYCQSRELLLSAGHLDAGRLLAFAPDLDQAALAHTLASIEDVCQGRTATTADRG